MDAKMLMVKAITIIYLSTKVKDEKNDIHKIVENVLKAVKPPERSIKEELTRDTAKQLRECVIRMLDESGSSEFNDDELKQRFELIAGSDEGIARALNSILLHDSEIDEVKLHKRLNTEVWNVKRMLDQEAIAKVARDWSAKLAWSPEKVNWSTLVEDMAKDYEGFHSLSQSNKSPLDDKAIINVIDFGDASATAELLNKAKEQWSSEGVLKTWYQGLNRMLGVPGGFRRGEMLLIGALRHNYKTGLCRDLFLSIPLCNKPYMVDPTKKPLNFRISFEDSGKDDVIQTYRRLKAVLDKDYQTAHDIEPQEAADYIYSKLGVNGYHNLILEIDPGLFSLEKIVDLIEYYEAQGFEIHHLNVDYLAMLTKNSTLQGDALTNIILNMFTGLRNVCRRKNIFVSTPHQLGPDAKQLQKEGVSDFVKQVANKSFYDSCRRIDQEVDVEVTVNKEECNSEFYLAFCRGKHRGVDDTPLAHQSFIYKFHPELGLPADFWGDDESRRKIGGDTEADGAAAPLWDIA